MSRDNSIKIVLIVVILLFSSGIYYFYENQSDQDSSERNSVKRPKESRPPEDFFVEAVSKSKYEPAMLNIRVGDTVTWKNVHEEAHTVSSGNFTNNNEVYFHQMLLPGESFSVTFEEPGVFSYSCLIKFHGMNGVIRVQE